jgi:ubiquinol-cytochrome c reductase cytochrome b subunit
MTLDLRAWLRERLAPAPAASELAPSLWRTFGAIAVTLLAIEALTGIALSAFYSPSTTTAWASVAYVQDQMALGWLVRGLHYHGASAMVIVCGFHLAQTAVSGAYRKPRELIWWLGLLLLVLVLGFAVTGYVLRWDQAGYWANRVEIGIAAGTPVIGAWIRALALGGNEYGNLTLTRFYALHVALLPGIMAAVVVAHVALARRHGATELGARPKLPRWPHQAFRDALMSALALAALFAVVVHQHGADLAAPADPGGAFDARPLWYFRWLFELRQLAGGAEAIAALLAPAVVLGFLAALPWLDRTSTPPSDGATSKARAPIVGATLALCMVIALFTGLSFLGDSRDEDLADRIDHADQLAARARQLAVANGVPVTGAQDVFATVPMYRARTLFEKSCRGCHDKASKDRKGPVIAAGHGDRAWLKAFLKAPSGDEFWGHTKLATVDDAMKPVELGDRDLDDLSEMLYAQSGASDSDAAKTERGAAIFKNACTDCHAIEDGVAGASAPSLAGLGSRDWYTGFIGNPKSPVHMGADKSQMPRFDKELSIVDRDALAGYLVWLRTATAKDVAELGAL